MTRKAFDNALKEIHNDVLRMGSIVEKQIHQCIESLVNQDEELAEQTIKNDDLVDELQREIEDKCIKVTAKEQPLAIDLRTVFTNSKLIMDLERIADHAVDIAKITLRLKNEKYVKRLIDIPEMSSIVNGMIKTSLDSYVQRDLEKAYEACKMDDKIDALFKKVFTDMIKIAEKDESKVNQMIQLVLVCKYLERIADRATNICEGTIYLVTGEQKDLNE
ncbi:phosphate signaling complex protein PhoU [Clostridium sp. MT-14]|jgi:phosphate transport system protein|uniref:Phosphate-specific transport system accessory protein PhoU n=1 Tax=Clostridium aromativorans TaxID=2836848 RepID=A0ABS8N4F2_9CLOT|nr:MULTISPECIES: phosphate signaling complex protein PhoU [Clostridium]KAA8677029.1 phosphate signaling complex protein PhoU [Clostridium sp. HV4-5-A1G]MCC9294688.1 phosphate signaling complex protein PhoU [Clostridium aromativorans]CAB1243535.1 Phosphate-specific transport system accessory protein PhoU homolog [Clostridiaceae bacterium BL-3]